MAKDPLYLHKTVLLDKIYAKDGTTVLVAQSGVTPGEVALTDGHILVGNSSGIAADVAMSGQATIADTGSVTLTNSAVIGKVLTGYASGAGTVAATDSILSAFGKINGNVAALSAAGVGGTLTATHIIVGNGSNVATDTAMSGDATISNAGVVTIGAKAVTGAKLVTGTGYFDVCVPTNGMSAVNVFGATVPFNATITSVSVISQDTTAGTITVADTAGTVATIAKGTVAGAMTGAVSLANASITSGNTLTVVSSSAGNAYVKITFTVA